MDRQAVSSDLLDAKREVFEREISARAQQLLRSMPRDQMAPTSTIANITSASPHWLLNIACIIRMTMHVVISFVHGLLRLWTDLSKCCGLHVHTWLYVPLYWSTFSTKTFAICSPLYIVHADMGLEMTPESVRNVMLNRSVRVKMFILAVTGLPYSGINTLHVHACKLQCTDAWLTCTRPVMIM